jgi:hypothetical protein
VACGVPDAQETVTVTRAAAESKTTEAVAAGPGAALTTRYPAPARHDVAFAPPGAQRATTVPAGQVKVVSGPGVRLGLGGRRDAGTAGLLAAGGGGVRLGPPAAAGSTGAGAVVAALTAGEAPGCGSPAGVAEVPAAAGAAAVCGPAAGAVIRLPTRYSASTEAATATPVPAVQAAVLVTIRRYVPILTATSPFRSGMPRLVSRYAGGDRRTGTGDDLPRQIPALVSAEVSEVWYALLVSVAPE